MKIDGTERQGIPMFRGHKDEENPAKEIEKEQ